MLDSDASPESDPLPPAFRRHTHGPAPRLGPHLLAVQCYAVLMVEHRVVIGCALRSLSARRRTGYIIATGSYTSSMVGLRDSGCGANAESHENSGYLRQAVFAGALRSPNIGHRHRYVLSLKQDWTAFERSDGQGTPIALRGMCGRAQPALFKSVRRHDR